VKDFLLVATPLVGDKLQLPRRLLVLLLLPLNLRISQVLQVLQALLVLLALLVLQGLLVKLVLLVLQAKPEAQGNKGSKELLVRRDSLVLLGRLARLD